MKPGASGTLPPDFLLLVGAPLSIEQVIGQFFCTGSLEQ